MRRGESRDTTTHLGKPQQPPHHERAHVTRAPVGAVGMDKTEVFAGEVARLCQGVVDPPPEMPPTQ